MNIAIAPIRGQYGVAVIVEHNGEYRRYCQCRSLGHANLDAHELRSQRRVEGDTVFDWDNLDRLTYTVRLSGSKRFELVA